MKSGKNKKKLIIIIISIVCVLALIAGAVVYLVIKNNKPKEKENPTEYNEKDVEEQVRNAFYNNFLITYILEGDIQVGEGTLRIDGSDDVYYAVTDYLLEDIHDISDINDLITNNLTPAAEVRARKVMSSSYANQYMSQNDVLYVKKTATPCFRLEEKVDMNIAEYKVIDNRLFTVYNNVPYEVSKDEDGKYTASTLWNTCIKDFGSIGIGKEDEFIPNAENIYTASDFNVQE